MKIKTALFVASTAFLVISCQKDDDCDPPPQTKKKCDLAQVIETSTFKEESYTRSRFRKEYDAYGKVNKVVLGLFQLALVDSINMVVKYQGNHAYLLAEYNPADTVVIATFDNADRLMHITQGNAANDRLVTAHFSYNASKLSNISFDFDNGAFELEPHYDAYGNVTALEDPSSGGGQSFYYTYDVGIKAKQQFYSDEFIGDAYNSLYLAEFMGWLPDLEPVNKRTSSRISLGEEGEEFDLYSADLTNHIYDSKGKLISYQIGEFLTFTNIWNCDNGTGNHNHMNSPSGGNHTGSCGH
jgi:hypothetical protein